MFVLRLLSLMAANVLLLGEGHHEGRAVHNYTYLNVKLQNDVTTAVVNFAFSLFSSMESVPGPVFLFC